MAARSPFCLPLVGLPRGAAASRRRRRRQPLRCWCRSYCETVVALATECCGLVSARLVAKGKVNQDDIVEAIELGTEWTEKHGLTRSAQP